MLRTQLDSIGPQQVAAKSRCPETFPPLTRLEKPTRRIRSVCVDQENIPERNQQVRFMSRIYSQAEVVLVWLGEDSSGVSSDLPRKKAPNPSSKLVKLFRKIRRSQDFRIKAALQQVFRQLYWTRAWILQEYVLANNLLIMFGATGETSSEFLMSWLLYFPKMKDSFDFIPSTAFMLTSGDVHEKVKEKSQSLGNLVFKFRDVQCSDPRDRVYALLGLANDREVLALEVDYSITMDQLCTNLKAAYAKGNANPFSLKMPSGQGSDMIDLTEADGIIAILQRRDHLPAYAWERDILNDDGRLSTSQTPEAFDSACPAGHSPSALDKIETISSRIVGAP